MWQPPRKTSVQDPISWALQHRSVRKQPLDHRLQPYVLEPMYNAALAMEPGMRGLELGFLKGRQTGLTTAAITLGLWHLDLHGGMTIHAVPTQANAENFNSTVLVPTLRDTDFENLKEGDIANRKVKTFVGAHSATYLLGHTLGGNQTSEGDFFRGQTAEVVIFDERGTMPERACAVIESCTDIAETPIILNIGSAGYRGDALDRYFRGGTRAEWAIPCASCGKHTIMAPYGSTVDSITGCYERNGDDFFYACEHCRRPINPAEGSWVHQEGEYPSYHIASMCSHFFGAEKLHKRIQNPNTTEESLMREVGGLPYGGEGVTVNPQDIKYEAPPKKGLKQAVFSADWGGESSWLVLKSDDKRTYVTEIGTVNGQHDTHVTQLYEVAKKHHPDYIAADNGFEGGRNEKLNDLTGCTWSMVTSLAPRPGNVYEQVVRDRKNRTYRVVRTWVWERIIEDLRAGKLVLAPGLEQLAEDILNVHPQKAGRATREWVSYEMTHQHFAACLLMAYSVHLREHSRRKTAIGTGNPMSFTGRGNATRVA